ncbi:MAG: LptA/OstA family protein [Hyphomicrobium sp.]|jgi:lipopolysaccharide transport protein LptA
MATTTAIDDLRGDARQIGIGLVLAGDRTAEYRRARRGTIFVRLLRVTLPLAALGLLATYVSSVLKGTSIGSSVPDIAIRQILPSDLAMNNPRYEGFGKDGSSYVFAAKTAQQDLTKPSIIKLNAITGTLTQADKSTTEVLAARGVFDNTAHLLELYDKIDVVSGAGLKAKLTRATIVTKEGILTSPAPVEIEFTSGTVRANTMTLRQKAREVTFVENVVASFTPPPPKENATPEPTETSSSALFKSSGGPIEIAANRLDASDQTKTAIFTGDVKATQGDTSMTAPELEVSYDGAGMMGTASAANASKDSQTGAASKIRRIIAKESVVMKRGETDVVTSENAEFDAETATAALVGNVVMTSVPDRRAASDRLDLDQRADTALLVGNVVVTQGPNELKGRRLFIDRKSGKAELTSPPGLGAGPGRISARLTRGDLAAGKKALAAKSGTDDSQFSFAAFKTDPSAPVDVEADQLEVNDKAKLAVFRGEVRAAQGEFVIKSAELYAYYKGEAGLAGATTAAPSSSRKTASTQLTRLEAKQNVFITSTDGQTASGDRAEFNTVTNKVTMTGNVVLAKGQNMVRGTRLLIDMTTGESKIDTAPPNTVSAPAGGGWVTERESPGEATPAGGGRASAVFFPQQLKDAQKAKAATKAAAPSASGPAPATAPIIDAWSPTTSRSAPSQPPSDR